MLWGVVVLVFNFSIDTIWCGITVNIKKVWRYQRGNKNSSKDKQNNGQKKKDKQLSTKHYIENTNLTINSGWTQMPWKGSHFLFH